MLKKIDSFGSRTSSSIDWTVIVAWVSPAGIVKEVADTAKSFKTEAAPENEISKSAGNAQAWLF